MSGKNKDNKSLQMIEYERPLQKAENNSKNDKYGRQILEVKVYPRTYIEEVTGIDSERRTVTAKFVLFITIEVPEEHFNDELGSSKSISSKSPNETLRNYIRKHLILQFGFNQTIFIPQHIVCENNPYLIKQIHSEDPLFSTYSIRGAIECSATFINQYFPFRKIEVFNHLCFMSQIYGDKILKYKVMSLKHDGNEDTKYSQFLPYFGNIKFGDYIIDQNSTLVNIGDDAKQLKKQMHARGLEHIHGVSRYSLSLIKQESKKQIKKQKSQSNGIGNVGNVGNKESILQEDYHKHILFKFDMISLQIPFVLQNQVPIWILSFVTLMLYEAQPSIGGKYSNIILLLVSYISIISNFRINNIEQMGYSFFELKVLILTIAPLLLIISTAIDFYPTKKFKEIGVTQLTTNGFGIASLVVVFLAFVATLGLLFYVHCHKFRGSHNKKTEQEKQQLLDWMNMIDLDWKDSSKELEQQR